MINFFWQFSQIVFLQVFVTKITLKKENDQNNIFILKFLIYFFNLKPYPQNPTL